MNIRDLRIGSTYYGETGINNTVTLGGGTALSVINSSQDVYVGHGDRAAASSNTLTVGANGDLNVTRHMYVGHVNNTANSDNPSTNNKLTVTGGGTASMSQLSLGFADADGRDAGANIVEVTSGGQLATSGTTYIGRADNPTSTSNANTLTVTGTGSSWNAGNQTVYVGHTNHASAQSNDNVLTVAAGGALINVNSLIVGAGAAGAGTETGNQLVLDGGSITATTVTVSEGNTLSGSGTINGAVTVNGTLLPGNSPGQLSIGALTLGSDADTTMELGGTTLGTGYDNVDVAGAIGYGGNLSVVNYALYDMDAASFIYDLFSFATTPTGDFSNVTVNSISLVGSLGIWTGTNGGVSYSFDEGTGDLTVAVVPEPASLALLGLGGLLLGRRRR